MVLLRYQGPDTSEKGKLAHGVTSQDQTVHTSAQAHKGQLLRVTKERSLQLRTQWPPWHLNPPPGLWATLGRHLLSTTKHPIFSKSERPPPSYWEAFPKVRCKGKVGKPAPFQSVSTRYLVDV